MRRLRWIVLPSGGSYKPLSGPRDNSRPGWDNPAGTYTLAPDQCELCHTIPKLTSSYCGIMKAMVDKGLMPPPPDSLKDYQDDLKMIKEECNKLDPGLKWTLLRSLRFRFASHAASGKTEKAFTARR